MRVPPDRSTRIARLNPQGPSRPSVEPLSRPMQPAGRAEIGSPSRQRKSAPQGSEGSADPFEDREQIETTPAVGTNLPRSGSGPVTGRSRSCLHHQSLGPSGEPSVVDLVQLVGDMSNIRPRSS